jgi:hypothetical protein
MGVDLGLNVLEIGPGPRFPRGRAVRLHPLRPHLRAIAAELQEAQAHQRRSSRNSRALLIPFPFPFPMIGITLRTDTVASGKEELSALDRRLAAILRNAFKHSAHLLGSQVLPSATVQTTWWRAYCNVSNTVVHDESANPAGILNLQLQRAQTSQDARFHTI